MSKEQENNGVSLNKYISSRGICSRREADKIIEAGKVKLNGAVAKRGNRVMPEDTVIVDGKKMRPERKPEKIYLAFNKPKGVECTTNQSVKDNIIDYINYPERIFPIGRLDKNSEGLILMTNDGDIVNKILRSRNEHEKEYVVKVGRPIDKSFLHHMSNGVPILGTITKKCVVEEIDTFNFKIILTQGLNRQIRRMCEALDFDVRKLKRNRVMNIELGSLPVGSYRKLKPGELKQLKASLKDSEK